MDCFNELDSFIKGLVERTKNRQTFLQRVDLHGDDLHEGDLQQIDDTPLSSNHSNKVGQDEATASSVLPMAARRIQRVDSQESDLPPINDAPVSFSSNNFGQHKSINPSTSSLAGPRVQQLDSLGSVKSQPINDHPVSSSNNIFGDKPVDFAPLAGSRVHEVDSQGSGVNQVNDPPVSSYSTYSGQDKPFVVSAIPLASRRVRVDDPPMSPSLNKFRQEKPVDSNPLPLAPRCVQRADDPPFSPSNKFCQQKSVDSSPLPLSTRRTQRIDDPPLSPSRQDKQVDPSLLSLAARRALFEAKMRGEYIEPEKQSVAAKTRLFESNQVTKFNSSEPVAKKWKYDELQKENQDFFQKTEETPKVSSSSVESSSPQNDLSKPNKKESETDENSDAEEVIAICLPKYQSNSRESLHESPQDQLHESPQEQLHESPQDQKKEELKEDDIAEALAAFQDIDEYSLPDNESNQHLDNKAEGNRNIHHNMSSSLSDISSLIDHHSESPTSSSTRLYPELPSLDDAVFETPTAGDKYGLPTGINHLSPIHSLEPSKEPLQPAKSVPIKSSAKENPSTPLRTLSMYRREQKIRAYQREDNSEDTDGDFFFTFQSEAQKRELWKKYNEFRAQKIDELKNEAEKFNSIIFQSLRAIDVCVRTHNVSERIEAERILLINTKKKKACVDEIYRLQNEEPTDITEDPVGRISFHLLILLVKGDFFVSQVNGHDLYEYHFICLFTCGDKVIATDSLSSTHAVQEAALSFNNKITFEDLRRDFKIHLELYAFAIPKAKHGQDKKFGTIRLTPKSKQSKTKVKYAHSPALSASPTNEKIRSNFKRLGHVLITRENCMKSRFELQDFMYSSPLEEEILLESTIGGRYDISFKSFLNFQEESGGFPAWHRRWCALDGHLLYYWRYAEDEGNKEPIGVINLKQCVNPTITKASTDLCMRPHSFAFVIIEKVNGQAVPVKHLMAADIRKEKVAWLEKLNQVLRITRFWEKDALQPYDQASLDRVMK